MIKIPGFSILHSASPPPTEENFVFAHSAFLSSPSRCRFERRGKERLRIRRKETKTTTTLTKVEKTFGAFSWAEVLKENIAT